jgi:hypothetical protein
MQKDAFAAVAFKLSLTYAIRKVQKHKGAMELNGTHHRLVCVVDNLLNSENT